MAQQLRAAGVLPGCECTPTWRARKERELLGRTFFWIVWAVLDFEAVQGGPGALPRAVRFLPWGRVSLKPQLRAAACLFAPPATLAVAYVASRHYIFYSFCSRVEATRNQDGRLRSRFVIGQDAGCFLPLAALVQHSSVF